MEEKLDIAKKVVYNLTFERVHRIGAPSEDKTRKIVCNFDMFPGRLPGVVPKHGFGATVGSQGALWKHDHVQRASFWMLLDRQTFVRALI